jgi:predicted thioesterase
MKSGLDPGVFAEMRVVVTPDMCPHFDGVLVHPVYATWTLVHHMEIVGRKLLVPYLEQHEEGVGAHVSVDHISPAYVGSSVTVRAAVDSCTHHRLTARMSAHCGERELARGVFVQVIMPKSRLKAIIERHRPQPG